MKDALEIRIKFKRISLIFFFCLLFHALLLVVLLRHVVIYDAREAAPLAMTTRTLTDSEFSELLKKAPTLKPAKPVDPSVQNLKRQIVETERSKEQLPSTEPAKYHSDIRNRTNYETVMPDFGSAKKNAEDSEKSESKETVKKVDAAEASVQKLSKFGLAKTLAPVLLEQVDSRESTESEKSVKHGSHDSVRRVLPIGPHTILNTDEYIHASFYNRFKREVAPRWEEMIQRYFKAQYSQKGELPKGVFVTNTRTFLNDEGLVIRVEIAGPSGLHQLDVIAANSIYSMQRSKHPPKELRNSEGLYPIELAFLVDTQSRGWRVDYRRETQ